MPAVADCSDQEGRSTDPATPIAVAGLAELVIPVGSATLVAGATHPTEYFAEVLQFHSVEDLHLAAQVHKRQKEPHCQLVDLG